MRVVLDCISVILCLLVIQLCTGSLAGEAAGVAIGRPETSAAASDASAATAAAEADADAASVGPRTAVGAYAEFQEMDFIDIAGQHITKVPSVSIFISTRQQRHHNATTATPPHQTGVTAGRQQRPSLGGVGLRGGRQGGPIASPSGTQLQWCVVWSETEQRDSAVGRDGGIASTLATGVSGRQEVNFEALFVDASQFALQHASRVGACGLGIMPVDRAARLSQHSVLGHRPNEF